MSIKTHRFLHVAVILSVILASCNNQGDQRNQGSRPLNVEGYVAYPEPFQQTIRSTGDILPWEKVEIRTPVAGNVQSIVFEEGSYIREGSLLIEIDSRIWKAQKKGLESRLRIARKDMERKKQLRSIDGSSQEEVDQAEAMVSELEAQIEELAVRIDLATIKAPFSGRVGMRDFSPGAYLAQGELVTSLVQDEQLRINFSVPARYAGHLKPGTQVSIISRSIPDTLAAQVYAIDPVINQNTRTMQVRAKTNNSEGTLTAGDFANVITEAQINENAILLPAESIIPELNSQVVYVVQEGKASKTNIETGTRTANRVHVLSGISTGDTIITTGLMEVRDGREIRITSVNQEVNP